MKSTFTILILLAELLFSHAAISQHTHADGSVHEDHDHSSETEPEEKTYMTSEAEDGKYELLLRYNTIEAGHDAHLTLFISDYNTNAPIAGAKIQLVVREDVKNQLLLSETSSGTWDISGVFKTNSVYSIAAIVNGVHGESSMILEDIHVGLHNDEAADEHHHHWYTSVWFVALISIIGGMLLLLLLQKMLGKKTGRLTTIALLVLAFIPSQPTTSLAHEGHDHEDEKEKKSFGSEFEIQKDTQFLMDMLTQKIDEGQEVMTQNFFGTVLPGSSGQAQITTPQNGRILSLHTSVGSTVRAGQLLVVIEGFIDAPAAMNIQAEKNNLQAEVEAARKECERLESIKDIIAKKDLDEAQARYKKAQDNLELFKSRSGTRIELKAPIDGVVDNFTLSIGASVLQGETLFTVVNPAVVYVDAQIYGDASAVVSTAKEFKVATAQGKELSAKLLAVPQTLHPSNQSQHVMFVVDNSEQILKIGEYITMKALIPTSKETIVIPASAITEVDGKTAVYIKRAAEKYEMQIVNLTGESNAMVNVSKGLKAGDRVIVHGTYQAKMIYLNR